MATGTVRSFDPKRGSGLITPEDGGDDVFVHVSAVEKAGLSHLEAGDRVFYEVMRSGAHGARFITTLRLL